MKDNNLFPLIVELIRNAKSVEEGTNILNKYLGAIVRTDEVQTIINSSFNEGMVDDYFDDKQIDALPNVETRIGFWSRYNNGDLKDYFKMQKTLKEDYEHELSLDANRTKEGLEQCSETLDKLPHYIAEDKQRVRNIEQ